MASDFWFFFDIYGSGRLVGRSRVFKIVGKETRQEACAAAEEEWLATGALAGDAYDLLSGVNREPNIYTLRDHPDSPTKE
jgi:hypothetical protein